MANDEDSRAFSAVSVYTLTPRLALAVVTNEALFGTYVQHVRSSMDMHVCYVCTCGDVPREPNACMQACQACVRSAFNVRHGSAYLM
jgi:hypothetical protein